GRLTAEGAVVPRDGDPATVTGPVTGPASCTATGPVTCTATGTVTCTATGAGAAVHHKRGQRGTRGGGAGGSA
ncbi:hypothetical protein, partial [Corynebacterium bovis]|uniref:hypothetical protein n=1 Tax=Corynebacterium bovis TaxID=36808 RepID=UPI001C8AA0C4